MRRRALLEKRTATVNLACVSLFHTILYDVSDAISICSLVQILPSRWLLDF